MKMIKCQECHEVRKHYGRGMCRRCYHRLYQREPERKFKAMLKRDRGRVRHKQLDRFCLICLGTFPYRGNSNGFPKRYCSSSCSAQMIHLRSFSGILTTCQRCQKLRIIRSKKLCNPCYVYSRYQMNKMGMYGRCATRINRLAMSPLTTGTGMR